MIAQNKIHEKMALYHQNSSKFQAKLNSVIPTCLVILTLNKRKYLKLCHTEHSYYHTALFAVILSAAKYPKTFHIVILSFRKKAKYP